MPRFPRLLALVLVPALLLAAGCGPSSDVAATVDGTDITVVELDRSISLYTFLGEVNGQGCGAPQEGETPESACARFTLSNLIQENIVSTYATQNDITSDPAEAAKAVDDLEASMGVEEMAAALEKNGISREDVVELAGRLFLFNEVRDDLATKVTDEDLLAAYDASTEFSMIHAKHILVEDQMTADEVAAKATAKNFGELAQQYSTDPGSAAQGGDLGPIAQSSLDADFVAGALALQPGEISAPVQTQFGWHIIQLVEVTKTPFEDVKEQLRAQQSTQAYADWLLGRYAEADIEVNPRYGRIDLSTGEVLPIRSTEDPSESLPPADTPSP